MEAIVVEFRLTTDEVDDEDDDTDEEDENPSLLPYASQDWRSPDSGRSCGEDQWDADKDCETLWVGIWGERMGPGGECCDGRCVGEPCIVWWVKAGYFNSRGISTDLG